VVAEDLRVSPGPLGGEESSGTRYHSEHMEEWLKNLPGQLAYQVIGEVLTLAALFALHNRGKLRRIFGRARTVYVSASSRGSSGVSATPTVIKLKPASLVATPQKLTVVRGKSLLSAAGELLWWWSQVR
jgi:hypothetical protein